ncbi:MAG: DUF971 domain-containing protein [Gemmatimonadales bacterium]
MDIPIPKLIGRQAARGDFLIRWDEGHEGVYPARVLRLACPCAECREEMTGRRLLDARRVPDDIDGVRVELVGRYGIRIDWSDGHHTGIYTYEMLYEMCPCASCSAAKRPRG